MAFICVILNPVHTYSFSNENRAVLLRFQKDLRSYRFARSHYSAVFVFKTLLYPQCACSNELDACAFQYIGPQNWREIDATWYTFVKNILRCVGFYLYILHMVALVRHFGYSRSSGLAPGRVDVYFDDVTIFR